MAVNRVVEALLDAQIKIVQAGFRMPVMEINGMAYYSALAASVPDVKIPKPGVRARIAYEDGCSGFSDTQEIWPTPEQDVSFEFAGPVGMVTVRRAKE